ncbi:LytR cell envelope-related transcriptional attenuator [Isoptericola sp. CG 20/1183]|uniref:LytR cell envelope-related transcriptional attenuator n=1 Tax=Isoptericola halotolerans TaxID=300560 RepID=A0ABX5EJB4_9MICO|nr:MULTISPECIES: LytR C-terminal domain-containing protein [Isoptericola]MCK0116444.1 LytR C-terminal domain-containing protein [Isoptericola sp. S6320L]PRZ08330.1 LytR cell envelope-related transcriptional attenuator [Isoptericola halotolerans]PRZ09127.1 LytR cell envelope-related transcriptional attenuator [Isoptericola sp. CG 20/1183]
MTSPAQDPARVARRRRKHERQAVVFGLIIAFLVVLGLGALAIYTDTIDSPIAEPIFTPSADVTNMAPACLPEDEDSPDGVLPMRYDKVGVRVFNAADPRFALAGAAEEVLSDRGFDVRDTGDFPDLVEGPSEIRYGAEGIVQAYTLAAQFADVELVMDDRGGKVVDLLIGVGWSEPLPAEEIPLAADEPLENMPGCVPASELDPVEREYGRGRAPDEA